MGITLLSCCFENTHETTTNLTVARTLDNFFALSVICHSVVEVDKPMTVNSDSDILWIYFMLSWIFSGSTERL